MMTPETLHQYCLSLPGATEDIKWGNDLCFCIAEKMFCVTALEPAPGGAVFPLSIKASPEQFEEHTQTMDWVPAPYLARAKWIHTDDASAIHPDTLKSLIRESYKLILAKLPKKVQQEIGG